MPPGPLSSIVTSNRLAIYLNDHLAAATLEARLVQRTARSNPDGDYGRLLKRLDVEVEEDREELRALMRRFEMPENTAKVRLAGAAERLGRLKPNGQLSGYSPLSRLVELEGLLVGIHARRSLWRSLCALAERDGRLDTPHLERLAARADAQAADVESHRPGIARDALAA